MTQKMKSVIHTIIIREVKHWFTVKELNEIQHDIFYALSPHHIASLNALVKEGTLISKTENGVKYFKFNRPINYLTGI